MFLFILKNGEQHFESSRVKTIQVFLLRFHFINFRHWLPFSHVRHCGVFIFWLSCRNISYFMENSYVVQSNNIHIHMHINFIFKQIKKKKKHLNCNQFKSMSIVEHNENVWIIVLSNCAILVLLQPLKFAQNWLNSILHQTNQRKAHETKICNVVLNWVDLTQQWWQIEKKKIWIHEDFFIVFHWFYYERYNKNFQALLLLLNCIKNIKRHEQTQ